MEHPGKLSVLFVDDEPPVLAVLARLLAPMSEHWRMEFAPSAPLALERISRSSFDVVLSDLRMPWMNGIELLSKVRELSPATARIIYSSYSDQQSVLECIGIIHQFLPKPSPLEALKAAITSAGMSRALLPDPSMREKVSRIERIPSLPTLYLELVRQLQSLETPIEQIAATVSRDVGMTAQILKIVNSAFFGLPQPTSNIAEAISFMGIDLVKHLVLAVGIFSQFENRKLGGLSLETLWQHSVRTANAAKWIARREAAGRVVVEDALAGGLLHDLGKLVLANNYPERCESVGQRALANNVEWLAEERKEFGFDHANVGGFLLGLWGLPPAVVEAVAFHHVPAKSKEAQFSALTAVHVANVLVQSRRPAHGGIAPPQVDPSYLAKIGRGEALSIWREELNEAPAI